MSNEPIPVLSLPGIRWIALIPVGIYILIVLFLELVTMEEEDQDFY